jgi:hypothetical protein
MHYTIRGSQYDYHTGVTAEGLQVFIVIACPYYITCFFDQDGNLIEVRKGLLSEKTRAMAEKDGIHEALAGPLDTALHSWLCEIGFCEAPITVKCFFLREYNIGIKRFPDAYSDILSRPADYSNDEYIVAKAESERWLSEGLSELWLNDSVHIWLDQTGSAV